jgi:hypothetical protein
MHGALGAEAEVQWSQEGDAWVGVLGADGHADPDTREVGRDSFEVELLLRATDWHVEMSHVARGAFDCEHIQAADADEAKAKATDLLRAFRAKIEEVALL